MSREVTTGPPGPSREEIARAASALRAGELVAFPTETVYGLGANALDARAVARVFEVKDRPRFDPLIVHLADAAGLDAVARDVPARARALVAAAWPGPVTIVVPKRPVVADLVTAGLPTVGVRVPDHPVALALLRAAELPVAAPSANRFGGISPTCAADVREELGEAAAIVLDGGACRVGLESTVVSFLEDPPRVLRPGAFTVEELQAVIGHVRVGTAATDGRPAVSPGQASRHYAPSTPLVLALDAADAAARARGHRAGLLTAGAVDAVAGAFERTEVLSPSGDLREAAVRLFQALRALDAAGLDLLVALPVPEEGLGRAINDRLRRAAAR